MKTNRKEKNLKCKSPVIDQKENAKYLKRLKIQQDVLKKLMDPITEQLPVDKLKETKITAYKG
jgi:DNA-directed RNA polymerase subunit H (RpoH/RPB5)